MGIGIRLTLPVIIFAGLALAVQAWMDGEAATLVLAMLGVVCTGTVLGQALTMGRRLQGLPQAVRQTAWGMQDAPFEGRDPSDEIGRTIAGLQDLSYDMRNVIEQRAEMERMAMTDSLTGLPNRRGLQAFLARVAADIAESNELAGLGVLHVDLDNFKSINDRFGHEGGDHILREATRLMTSAIRDSDLLTRLGGDEFVVIAPRVDSEQALVQIAERIVEQFTAPVTFQDQPCEIGASIGIVLGGKRGKLLDPARLLLHADIALCHAKSTGSNRHAVFSSTMARSHRRRHNQAEEIRDGLDNDAFRPWFQPSIDPANDQLAALHISPRWDVPGYGLISPDEFLITAEAHNMIEELGLRIVEHTCRIAADWRRDGLDIPRLHLTMNRAQLLGQSIADQLSWCVDDAGLEPSQFALEIDERHCRGRGGELIFANLERCRLLGFAIVLSDFGADGAGLGAMSRLQADMVVASTKLTGPDAGSEVPAANQILQAGLGATQRMNIPMAARNVETPEHATRLQQMDIAYIQGPVTAQIMNHDDMRSWLTGRDKAPEATDSNIVAVAG